MGYLRLWLGGAGVLLAAAAVVADSHLLGWIAGVVLAVAVAFRLRARQIGASDEPGAGLPHDG